MTIRKLDDPTSSSTTAQSPADLTQLYFSYLYEHLKATLVAKLSASVFESTPIDFILTVPAIWSLAAKQKTETAATRAGFKGSKKIHLVTEPVSPIVDILAIELIAFDRKPPRFIHCLISGPQIWLWVRLLSCATQVVGRLILSHTR
jgi:hypothetical protein